MKWYRRLFDVKGALNSIAGADLLGNRAAAQSQADAQSHAADLQAAEAQKQRDYLQGRSDLGIGYVKDYGDKAASSLSDYYDKAQGFYGQAGQALGQGRDRATAALASGYGQARQDLGGFQSRLGGLLDQGLYSNFQTDPGYQFRQHQGEQALNRATAARGGRYGGNALKALADYNSGLASQEYGNFAGRQQALAGIYGGADSQDMAHRSQLADLAYRQGAGQSSLESGYGSGLAAMYGNQAGAASNQGSSLAQLYQNTGSNLSNAALGTAGSTTALSQGLMGMYQHQGDMGGGDARALAGDKAWAAGQLAGVAGYALPKIGSAAGYGAGKLWDWATG